MYLLYGTYQHPLNEATVAISRDTLTSDTKTPYAIRHRWDISGYLQAADQPSLTTAILALESAYAIQGQNIGLYLDNGTPTAHVINSAKAVGGVIITSPPSYEIGDGAEYTTFRHYRMSIQAEIPTGTSSLISWEETLSFLGTSGPRVVWMEIRNGAPQKQIVSENTVCEVRQVGRAVGYLGYPIAARPIWPQAEMLEQRSINTRLPETEGSGARRVRHNFEINWSYVFKSDQQLSGLPTPRYQD